MNNVFYLMSSQLIVVLVPVYRIRHKLNVHRNNVYLSIRTTQEKTSDDVYISIVKVNL